MASEAERSIKSMSSLNSSQQIAVLGWAAGLVWGWWAKWYPEHADDVVIVKKILFVSLNVHLHNVRPFVEMMFNLVVGPAPAGVVLPPGPGPMGV